MVVELKIDCFSKAAADAAQRDENFVVPRWDNFKGLDNIRLSLIHTQLVHVSLSYYHWVSCIGIGIGRKKRIWISGRLSGVGKLDWRIRVMRILRVLRLAACLDGVGEDVAI